MIGVKRAGERQGFTLVEILVVMSSFIILVTIISDIYVQTTRFGRSVILHAKLQADARNTVEAVSRAIRVSDIDYATWGGTLPAQPMTELRLINPTTANVSRIKLEPTNAGCFNDAKSYPCVTVSTDGGTTWTPLSPRGAKVDSLLFYVAPSQDPFLFNQATGTYAGGNQPYVVMNLVIHGLGTRASDDWIFTLQTTITPRLYVR